MKLLIILLLLSVFGSAKGQVGKEIDGDELINNLINEIEERAINTDSFLSALKENPLTVMNFSKTIKNKNDFIIIKGEIRNIDIVGENNSACEISFIYDYVYNLKIYLPIQKDFYDLKKGVMIYAIINIDEVNEYYIICDVALAAKTSGFLAGKLLTLVTAMEKHDEKKLRELLDVGTIPSFYSKSSFENNLRFFIDLFKGNNKE